MTITVSYCGECGSSALCQRCATIIAAAPSRNDILEEAARVAEDMLRPASLVESAQEIPALIRALAKP